MGVGFRVQGCGFRAEGSGFKVQGPGFKAGGAGFKRQESGCWVPGAGLRIEHRGEVSSQLEEQAGVLALLG